MFGVVLQLWAIAAAAAFGALPTFDWVFMGAGNFFVLFCLLLVATPLGRVRLGGVDARPDYSRSTWFAMLFAAGMGIGLMFFGVSEPVEHFLQPPLGFEAADTAAARLGMASAIYHWGIHGWAIYAVVGLSIAFASYNLAADAAQSGHPACRGPQRSWRASGSGRSRWNT